MEINIFQHNGSSYENNILLWLNTGELKKATREPLLV